MSPGPAGASDEERPRPRHWPRKRFGQHFLEAAWAAKVVAAVAPKPGERLLEIGPGLGAITVPLADTGVPLRAIEIDRDLAAALRERVPAWVSVICADFLALDAAEVFGSEPGAVRCVGNLPYNLSSPILIRLLSLARDTGRITDATLMLQREVADRVVANPGSGDYGPLAILLGLHATRTRVLSLPPGAFRPPPEVHSAVVRLTFHPPDRSSANPATLERLVRVAFQQRRKTVGNALKALASASGRDAPAILRAAGLDPSQRPEALAPQDYVALADAWDRADPAFVL